MSLHSSLRRESREGNVDPVIGHAGMIQSCVRGGSDWTLGCISLPREWSNNVQTSWRWDYCPKPVNVQKAFE